MNKYWNIKKTSEDSAEISILGEIGESWFPEDGTISARDFKKDIDAVGDVKNITVDIDSIGGDVFQGTAIANMLELHDAEITTRIIGVGASIASLIFMAGDKREIAKTGLLMIHNPWTIAGGEVKDMEKAAESLKVIKQALIKGYSKTGINEQHLSEMMDNETFMDSDSAIKNGFATGLAEKQGSKPKISNKYRRFFNKIPDSLFSHPGNDTDKLEENTMSEETMVYNAKKEDAENPDNEQLLKDAAENARADEQCRVSNILEIANKFGRTDLAQKFIDEGKTTGEFKDAILNAIHISGGVPVEETIRFKDEMKNPFNDYAIGMSPREVKGYSILRALDAAANPGDKRKQEKAGLEFRASEAAIDKASKNAKTGASVGSRGGFVIPTDVLVNKQFKNVASAGVLADGGYTVDTELRSMIDALETRLLVRRMGATIFRGLTGNVAFPKSDNAPAPEWVAENNAAAGATPGFSQLLMSPKSVTQNMAITRRLLIQSSIDVENHVRMQMMYGIAKALDLAAIAGTGAGNEPEGILNNAGIPVHELGTNGDFPEWADVVAIETLVSDADADDLNSLGYLTNTAVKGLLKTTEKAANTGMFVLTDGRSSDGFEMLNGYRMGVSNNVPRDLDKGTSVGVCSAMIYGAFSQLYLGFWGGTEIIADPYSGSKRGEVSITVFQDADVGIAHDTAFAIIKDALTA